MMPKSRPSPGCYCQAIPDILHSGSRPCRGLDRNFLVPALDLALEQNFAFISHGDTYVPGFYFGVPRQGIFDLPFYVVGFRMRLNFDR
jgi:hypothetical protein